MFSMEYESLCNSYCFNSSAVWIWWFKKLFTWKSHFIFPVEASKYLVGLVAKRACPSAMKMWPLKWQKCYSFMIAYRQHSIKKKCIFKIQNSGIIRRREKNRFQMSVVCVACVCCWPVRMEYLHKKYVIILAWYWRWTRNLWNK